MAKRTNLPEHIGIIMDGNGRWAKQRGLSRSQGHKKGANVFREICDYACEIGIKSITFYAFSTENWSRPPQEVEAIMELFKEYLCEAQDRKEENIQKGMRMHFIGERDGMPEDIIDLIETAQRDSADSEKIDVNIAINYGGRQEIVAAVKKIAKRVKSGEIDVSQINEQMIADNIYTSGQPDPDLIIRPSGEYRLSNFLIWQSAYSEFWFSDILWPDFTKEDLDTAIADYQKRSRRFGGI